MLFWKIGRATDSLAVDWGVIAAAASAVSTVFFLSTVFAVCLRMPALKVSSFSQSCYRFNTYIGLAVILTALGEDGIRQFGMMIAVLIPLINLLAVGILIWFSARDYSLGQRSAIILRALVSNPLIVGCLAGILYNRLAVPFPAFLENTFNLLTMATLPLAMLSIGAALNLNSLKGHFQWSLALAVFKLAVLPAVGWGYLTLFQVTGAAFKMGMIFFALPTSTALYVLSSQLNSDTDLAAAAIGLSTVLSFISLSFSLLL
jgi:predicted permease